MTTTLLFGGQGSQRPGMLHDWAAVPAVRSYVETASEVLGEDAWALDTSGALQHTRAVQLSLLILQTGLAHELQDSGVMPSYAAGHSLGAWSAAVAAGAVAFSDALRMVDIRATGMASAAPAGYGMAAVIGLSQPRLESLLEQLRAAGEEIWVANLNSAGQTTVSGSSSALERLESAAAAAGAQRLVRLEVAVPAHSPLMRSAREKLGEAMADVPLGRPLFPLLSNTTGRMIRTASQVREDLIYATDRPVQWRMGIAALSERRVTNWVQVSPGSNLIGLLRDVKGEAQAWCTDNAGLDGTVTKITRQPE